MFPDAYKSFLDFISCLSPRTAVEVPPQERLRMGNASCALQAPQGKGN